MPRPPKFDRWSAPDSIISPHNEPPTGSPRRVPTIRLISQGHEGMSRAQPWTRLSDEALLRFRFCDLKLTLERSPLRRALRRLAEELGARGLAFEPHVWLSEEWFSPDGVPGFALPFYLAHPRLARLERKQVLEVEGGSAKECMGFMRHEAGHALDNAFRFRSRRRWRELFGL